ncbi:URK [Enterospora canceri]|uniref:URK n=1 Tax=Enterospora canceri TaxID=1081671 RepID=A0A1Y1S5I6_9MICR|nr:URK [Enterospora canceri]
MDQTKTSKTILFILIQGSTCSGKTSFADYIDAILSPHLRIERIALDEYYKKRDFLFTDPVARNYDFDCPAAFDWDDIAATITGYVTNDRLIRCISFDFATQRRAEYHKKNTNPDVIVVEGLYAFNLFNSSVFDCSRISCWKKPPENENELIENETGIAECRSIRILLQANKKRVKELRAKRDQAERNTTAETESLDVRLDEYVWPATEKWVHSAHSRVDYLIPDGSFNVGECMRVAKELQKHLMVEGSIGEIKKVERRRNTGKSG